MVGRYKENNIFNHCTVVNSIICVGLFAGSNHWFVFVISIISSFFLLFIICHELHCCVFSLHAWWWYIFRVKLITLAQVVVHNVAQNTRNEHATLIRTEDSFIPTGAFNGSFITGAFHAVLNARTRIFVCYPEHVAAVLFVHVVVKRDHCLSDSREIRRAYWSNLARCMDTQRRYNISPYVFRPSIRCLSRRTVPGIPIFPAFHRRAELRRLMNGR